MSRFISGLIAVSAVVVCVISITSIASLVIDSNTTVVTYGDKNGAHTDVISFGGEFLENREYDDSNRLVGRMFIDRHRQVHVIRIDPETGVENETITQ